MIDRRTDKTALGVSGGKDSMSLLHILSKNHYNPVVLTVDEGIKGYRDKTARIVHDYCDEHDIPAHVFSFKKAFGTTIDKLAQRRSPCSACGVLRRRLLNNAARELGCTKLAVAHNLDDETQTVLMNFFRSEFARIARSGPITDMTKNKKFVPRIKPLRECPERESVAYALLNNVPYSDAECPYAQTAYRNSVRRLLNEMEEKHAGTKFGVLRAFDRLTPVLRRHYAKGRPSSCQKCGEPSADTVCKVCRITQSF